MSENFRGDFFDTLYIHVIMALWYWQNLQFEGKFVIFSLRRKVRKVRQLQQIGAVGKRYHLTITFSITNFIMIRQYFSLVIVEDEVT